MGCKLRKEKHHPHALHLAFRRAGVGFQLQQAMRVLSMAL